MERLQFRVLYRVFLLRVVDLDVLSPDGDPTKLLGQIAAILAAISFFACVPLITVGSRLDENTRWIAQFIFISITMLVVGLFSVLSWDSIFPDKRDLLVLGPLPVAPRTILIAKLAALGHALGLLALALNVFIGIIWPPILSSAGGLGGVIRSYGACWASLLAASAFMFFSVLTAQGLASQLLPRQVFLRASAPIQATAFCLFLGTFILQPVDAPAALLRSPAVRWLPSYWFFGLAEQIRGASGPMQQVFADLAHRGEIALSFALIGAAATLLSFYLRRLGKIVEAPDILPAPSRRRLFVGKSFRGAILLFCMRTLLRSRQHRVILSFYYGVGFAIVLAYAFAIVAGQSGSQNPVPTLVGPPLLAVSLLMMCVTVGGVRIVAPMPITLPANWIFRITELRAPSVYLDATRWSFITLGALPAWLASCIVFLPNWPLRLARAHLFVFGLFGLVLVELCMLGFTKIPFACSYLPGKGKIQFAFWACLTLLLPLIDEASDIEMRALTNSLAYGEMVAVLCLTLAATRWKNTEAMRKTERMRFDELEPPILVALSLKRN
jgi:hypothetical protein